MNNYVVIGSILAKECTKIEDLQKRMKYCIIINNETKIISENELKKIMA